MVNNMDILRGKIAEAGYTKRSLAKALGINEATLHRKISANGLSFTVGEMHRIVDLLALTSEDAKKIFLQ